MDRGDGIESRFFSVEFVRRLECFRSEGFVEVIKVGSNLCTRDCASPGVFCSVVCVATRLKELSGRTVVITPHFQNGLSRLPFKAELTGVEEKLSKGRSEFSLSYKKSEGRAGSVLFSEIVEVLTRPQMVLPFKPEASA
jgi:hypothetical protein